MPRLPLAVLLTLSAVPGFAADLPPGAVARLGSPVLRHPERPVVVALTADGSRLATGGTDGTLRVWDAGSGAELMRVSSPDAVVTAVAFSPDGKRLVAHFGDDLLRVYDARTLREVRRFQFPNADALAATDGGLVGAVGTTGTLTLVEAATGLDRMELPDGKALALAADGSAVAVSDAADRVTVLEVPGGKPRLSVRHLNRDGITSIAFSPDGSRLATAERDDAGWVRVWDARSGEKLAEWLGQGPVAFVGSDTVVGRKGGTVATWSVATGKPGRELPAAADSFAVSADGKRAATIGFGARIRVWDAEAGTERVLSGGELGDVAGLAAGPGGGLLIASPTTVARWAPGADRSTELLPGRPGVVGVVGTRLLAAAADGVGVWDDPGKAEPARVLGGVKGFPRSISGTPDGKRVEVLTGDRSLALADPATGAVLRAWEAPYKVLAVALHPAGDRATVVGGDGHVRCYDLSPEVPAEAWKARVPRTPQAGVAASADGRFVVATSIIRVHLFDPATGAVLHAFDRKWEDGPYRCVAVSPDGRLIAAGCQGSPGAVLVWEAATRGVVRRFAGGTGTVRHLAFLDGGRKLAAASADDNVLVWDVAGPSVRANPSADDLAAAWDRLDRANPEDGFPAAWALAAGGPRAAAVVRDGLARAAAVDARVKALITDLDSDRYKTRAAAASELRGLGQHALVRLRAAADTHPSAEVREAAAGLVRDLARAGVAAPPDGLFAESLRQVRAVAALEAAGGPEAVAVLEVLARLGGRPGEEAAAALKRVR